MKALDSGLNSITFEGLPFMCDICIKSHIKILVLYNSTCNYWSLTHYQFEQFFCNFCRWHQIRFTALFNALSFILTVEYLSKLHRKYYLWLTEYGTATDSIVSFFSFICRSNRAVTIWFEVLCIISAAMWLPLVRVKV